MAKTSEKSNRRESWGYDLHSEVEFRAKHTEFKKHFITIEDVIHSKDISDMNV